MIYISDLDGTLLNSSGQLSQNTISIINKLTEEGMLFTIASARSIYTAGGFIEQLKLTIPVILRNGAFIHNPENNEILMKKMLGYKDVQPVMEYFIEEGFNPMVHHSINGELFVDYKGIYNYGEEHYISSRLEARDRRFRKVSAYKYSENNEFIAICIIGENGRQDAVFEKLSAKFGDDYIIHKYIDTYSNHTWIEISHSEATKKNAVDFVLGYLGEKEYTAFGDNINDMEMLANAAQSYVPKGAYLDRERYGYDTIAAINEDGVAEKLLEIHSKK